MRNITEIVIHHAAVEQMDMYKILKSFDDNHKKRLTDVYSQPNGETETPNISYHYIINNKEAHYTRRLDVPGYHASNYGVNLASIGVCLAGDLDNRPSTEEQTQQLIELVQKLKKEFPPIQKVSGHQELP